MEVCSRPTVKQKISMPGSPPPLLQVGRASVQSVIIAWHMHEQVKKTAVCPFPSTVYCIPILSIINKFTRPWVQIP